MRSKSINQGKIPWEEIASKLNGNADPHQIQTIEDWLKHSDQNLEIYREIISSWQLSRKQPAFYQPDMDRLWSRLLGRIDLRSRPVLRLNPNFKWIAAAAVIILIFLSGIWIGGYDEKRHNDLYTSVIAPSGSRTKVILPDSTSVWLNSGAEIRYPSAFNKGTRDVHISGECFFDVTRDKERPFIVEMNGYEIKVLGTVFNVSAYANEKKYKVSLLEGSVELLNNKGKVMTVLTPNKEALLKEDGVYISEIENPDRFLWWKGLLVFENESFKNILQTLERNFDIDIEVKNKAVLDYQCTGKFRSKDGISHILKVLQIDNDFEFDYNPQKNIIVIK